MDLINSVIKKWLDKEVNHIFSSGTNVQPDDLIGDKAQALRFICENLNRSGLWKFKMVKDLS